ncbi:hypothetical protein BBG47_25755 [Paenibacillus sp. KS1]|uniref:hypothetical protein n=1 Tax=Paenibacillus sp. KS1 TaxID=1849249 RepID=UPI0008066115|nr:hypothetical protein [Paenibacillus sp. KS1]OBY76668.1 hypothetical protein BBG47_25755 [Paenibacillus sp. KS1]
MEDIINKLSVENRKSKYVKIAHPIILIDEQPLDDILNEFYPDDMIVGLIPTIVDWISYDEESKVIEDIYDSKDVIKILPILMCPDDCDLSCTVIVAEVETTKDQIKWTRIGIDKNNPMEVINKYKFFETGIEWLVNVPGMTFSKEDYKSLDKIYKRRTPRLAP